MSDGFVNSMTIFPNQLLEWKMSFMGCYLDCPSALGMLHDGITKKFKNINIFPYSIIDFLGGPPCILLEISNLEANFKQTKNK